MVLKELILTVWEGVVVLKELNLTDFTLERCGCLDNRVCNFEGYGLLIFNSF